VTNRSVAADRPTSLDAVITTAPAARVEHGSLVATGRPSAIGLRGLDDFAGDVDISYIQGA